MSLPKEYDTLFKEVELDCRPMGRTACKIRLAEKGKQRICSLINLHKIRPYILRAQGDYMYPEYGVLTRVDIGDRVFTSELSWVYLPDPYWIEQKHAPFEILQDIGMLEEKSYRRAWDFVGNLRQKGKLKENINVEEAIQASLDLAKNLNNFRHQVHPFGTAMLMMKIEERFPELEGVFANQRL